MCEVACGRSDLYFHTALQPWDSAAAFLIVREAGGRVAGFDGADAHFLASGAIAGNRDLVEGAVRCFQNARGAC
jgi:myo-inositol-1(or 4)-monophosphatase